jgi:hypothetical protein
MIPRVDEASRHRCRLSRLAHGWTGLLAADDWYPEANA